MIVDTLTHVWESPDQLGCRAPATAESPGGRALAAARRAKDPLADRLLHADPLEHFESLGPVDVALVFSFQSRLTETKIPNKLVANYVASHPDRLIGVAGIDPAGPDSVADLAAAVDRMGFKAAAISPSAQGFHPMDSRIEPFCREVVRRDLPLFVYGGPAPSPLARGEWADPMLLDELLREHPDLRIVLGGLSLPWIDRCFGLMVKQPTVLASVGGLLRSPWQAYNALVTAQELGLLDRLLFASDLPFAAPAACIEALYSINRLVHGTGLPTVPRELLRGIVERDSLALLGIDSPRASAGAGSREAGADPDPTQPTDQSAEVQTN
jgi:predicted TIM-barrel fold metal-dependent hydrolase